MNEQQKLNWLKAQSGAMRATSAADLAAKQLRDAEGAANAGMRPVPGMQNMWASDPDAWAPAKKRPSLFARLIRWIRAA